METVGSETEAYAIADMMAVSIISTLSGIFCINNDCKINDTGSRNRPIDIGQFSSYFILCFVV